MTPTATKQDFTYIEGKTPLEMEKPTYNAAFELITKICNVTQLGCMYYNVDHETATDSDKENARSKMKSKLRKPTQKTIDRVNDILFPFINLISDQQIKKIADFNKKK